MMMKLSRNESMDGVICFNASQKSCVFVTSVEGILMSMINKVIAIANTPSQKVSNRALGLWSDIIGGLFRNKWC